MSSHTPEAKQDVPHQNPQASTGTYWTGELTSQGAPLGWCPDDAPRAADLLAGMKLRQLRGEPPVAPEKLNALLRVIWARWTHEEGLIPSAGERASLESMLNVRSRIHALKENPTEVLNALQMQVISGINPAQKAIIATECAAIALTISTISPEALGQSSLELAASSCLISPWNLSTNLQSLIPMITLIIRGVAQTPQQTLNLLGRLALQSGSDVQPSGLIQMKDLLNLALASDVGNRLPAGPGPLLACAVLSTDAESGGQLRAELARAASPTWRLALAAASWRSERYDRSRHPQLSEREVLEITRNHRSESPPTPARLVMAALESWNYSVPSISVSPATREEPLITSSGRCLQWHQASALPGFKREDTRPEQASHHLNVKFAALPVIHPERGGPDRSALILKVCALIHLACKCTYSLPEKEEGLALLNDPALGLPHHHDPEVQAALRDISTHPRTITMHQNWAQAALNLTSHGKGA